MRPKEVLVWLVLAALAVIVWAALSQAQEPTGSTGVVPAIPNGSTPPALPGASPGAAPAVPPAPAATGPAATTPTPSITVTIPHDDHLHVTSVRHWHFPARTPRAAKPAPPPPVVVQPTPQAPAKHFRFFHP